MSKNFSCGIDIGSDRIKVVIVAPGNSGERAPLFILGTGAAESAGVQQGYIHNPVECARAVRAALADASAAARCSVRRAIVGIGGIGLSSLSVSGAVAISRADGEITDLDVQKAVEAARASIATGLIQNRRIVHTDILAYRVDGKSVPASPIGMQGAKLEVRVFFGTAMTQHLEHLLETAEEAGTAVEEMIASPLAAASVLLSRTQKAAGAALLNIGSETVSLAVFENGLPTAVEVFPVGSINITNDIALGLRVPLEEAEGLKRGAVTGTAFPQRKLDEIIAARLTDVFELVEAHLKKIGRSGLLPAGVVLTGGGSALTTLDDVAKATLRLPARFATLIAGPDGKPLLKDASWSVAYGLAAYGLARKKEGGMLNTESMRTAGRSLAGWFKQFLP
jgi:cell division protein FtsA